MGRRKIEYKKISNKAYLKATYSKRRKGLFRKAAELCELSGSEIAILTVSPGKKFYNFGHPHVDAVIARYCGEETHNENHDDSDGDDLEGKRGDGSADEMDDEPIDGRSLVVSANKEDIDDDEEEEEEEEEVEEAFSHKFWWEEPIDEDMDPEHRAMYIRSLRELRNNVVSLLNDRKMRESYTKDYISGIM